jgi:hypothetical protein
MEYAKIEKAENGWVVTITREPNQSLYGKDVVFVADTIDEVIEIIKKETE